MAIARELAELARGHNAQPEQVAVFSGTSAGSASSTMHRCSPAEGTGTPSTFTQRTLHAEKAWERHALCHLRIRAGHGKPYQGLRQQPLGHGALRSARMRSCQVPQVREAAVLKQLAPGLLAAHDLQAERLERALPHHAVPHQLAAERLGGRCAPQGTLLSPTTRSSSNK